MTEYLYPPRDWPGDPREHRRKLAESIESVIRKIDSLPTGGGSSPITTLGDLIVGDALGLESRLPIGPNGNVLTSDGITANWAPPAGGGSSPIIARGDIITGDIAGNDQRLPLGPNGQVLTSNGNDAVWALPASGGGNVVSITDESQLPNDLSDIGTAVLIASDIDITNNVTIYGHLIFIGGGLTSSNGRTVTFSGFDGGGYQAGNYQIFKGNLNVNGPVSATTGVMPQHFGAFPDGHTASPTDHADIIQECIDLTGNLGTLVFDGVFGARAQRIQWDNNDNSGSTIMAARGKWATRIKGDNLEFNDPSNARNGGECGIVFITGGEWGCRVKGKFLSMTGIMFYGGDQTFDRCMVELRVADCKFNGCSFIRCHGPAIFFAQNDDTNFFGCQIGQCGGHANTVDNINGFNAAVVIGNNDRAAGTQPMTVIRFVAGCRFEFIDGSMIMIANPDTNGKQGGCFWFNVNDCKFEVNTNGFGGYGVDGNRDWYFDFDVDYGPTPLEERNRGYEIANNEINGATAPEDGFLRIGEIRGFLLMGNRIHQSGNLVVTFTEGGPRGYLFALNANAAEFGTPSFTENFGGAQYAFAHQRPFGNFSDPPGNVIGFMNTLGWSP